MARRKSNVTKAVKINGRDAKAFELLSVGGWIDRKVIEETTSKNRVEVWRDKEIWETKSYTDNNGNKIERVRLTRAGEKLAEKEFGLTDHARTKISSIGHDSAVGDKLCTLSDDERKTALTEDGQWRVFHSKLDELRQEVADLRNKSENIRHYSKEEREEARNQWEDKLNKLNRVDEMLKDKKFSAPDLAYTSAEGTLICYEVITGNYSKEEIQQKQDFADFIGAELIKENV